MTLHRASWSIPHSIALQSVRLTLVIALTGLSVGSLLPAEYVAFSTWEDKLVHFSAYAVVGLLAMLSFRSLQRRVICLICLTCLGIALEFGQRLVPGRSFDFFDMLANAAGALVAFPLAYVVKPTLKRIIPTTPLSASL